MVDDGPGDDFGGVAVDVDAHDVAAAGEHDEWYECEGDAEGEHDLAEHEDVGGVEADREDDDRGDHRDLRGGA